MKLSKKVGRFFKVYFKTANIVAELMEKVTKYFGSQLLAYLHDGFYSIDNSIAERAIRPLADEYKNSLFFEQ